MSMQQKLEATQNKARQYAKEEKKAVSIVPENGGFAYYDAEYAAAKGMPTVDYIPGY